MATSSGLSSSETVDLFRKYVVPNYTRFPVTLVRGEGSYVWDAEGNRYLDLFPGWGCNLLGHCPAPIVRAVQEQVATLIHVPNTWYTEAQGQWAKLLSERSFGGQAFFCNSGTEANEAAIKLARLHTPKERYKIISFSGGFHGRTLGATAATAQPKYHEGLGPLMAGFVYAPFGDLEAVSKLVDGETAAILVEPIQGEGGIRIPPDGFLAGLRELADEHGLLLMFDEVQSGCGRTGSWFAYQDANVVPDVASHPVNAMRRAGVHVTINSDDPSMFGTTLNDEYLIADTFSTVDSFPLVERVRKAILATPPRVTASMGVISTPMRGLGACPPGDLLDELIGFASTAMNEARLAGGNQARYVTCDRPSVLGNADQRSIEDS